nr:hypothetical protein [Tanacetum cinerariifolium]
MSSSNSNSIKTTFNPNISHIFMQKEADDKIKEGTLNLDARGVGSGVTYKSQLMNQLAAQRVQSNLSSQFPLASDVTPMAVKNIDSSAYEVDGTQSSVVVRNKDARI